MRMGIVSAHAKTFPADCEADMIWLTDGHRLGDHGKHQVINQGWNTAFTELPQGTSYLLRWLDFRCVNDS